MSKRRATIGVDVRPLQAGFKEHAGRGTGRYTDELVRHLLMLEQAQDLPFALQLVEPAPPAAFESMLHKSLVLGKRTFESQVLYPRQVARTGVDLMHFFHHGDAPSRPLSPHVVTVLDLIPLRFPKLYAAAKSNLRFRFARYLELQAIRKAQGLFAISEATKRDVVELLGVHPDRIKVTPLAVTSQFQPAASPKAFDALPEQIIALGSEQPLLLYVGGIDPRKNVPFLIDVLAGVSEVSESKPLLVLAGGIQQDDQYPYLQERIEFFGMRDQVIELGRVSEAALLALYQRASIFLFPSLYEGFGFPVLEAMACGCPVIAGNNSSIPEVAGEAAILLPDQDHKAWIDAVAGLLANPAERAQRRALGLARRELFSWEKTAQATIEGYAQFLQLPLDHTELQEGAHHAAG